MTFLSNLDDPTYQPGPPTATIDPHNLHSSSPRSSQCDIKQEQLPQYLPTIKPEQHTSETSTPTTATQTSSSPPPESASTLRARYAAEQRHQKTRQRQDSHQTQVPSPSNGSVRKLSLSEKADRHREKNKVAASKCRARKKKQQQKVQDKGTMLSDSNAELKACIQGLRQELNGLRGLALGHQDCDCQISQYNCQQAGRIAAEYRDACMGSAGAGYP